MNERLVNECRRRKQGEKRRFCAISIHYICRNEKIVIMYVQRMYVKHIDIV